MTGSLAADLAGAVVGLLARRDRVTVAVDGPDAAGKTTLADAVAAEVAATGGCAVRASADGFHRPAAERRRRGALSAEGYYLDAFDLDALRDRLLTPFASGAASVDTAVFDYVRDQPVDAPSTAVSAQAALIVDGVFLLRPELRDAWALSVYLSVPPGESVRRAVVRDLALFGSPERVRERYAARYLPAQERYRAEADPESLADVVVDFTDPRAPAVRAWRGRAAPYR